MCKTPEQRSEDGWWQEYTCPLAGTTSYDLLGMRQCEWANCPGPQCIFFAESVKPHGVCAVAMLVEKGLFALAALHATHEYDKDAE